MKKQLMVCLIILSLLIGLLPAAAMAEDNWIASADTSWYTDSSAKEFTISTAAQLAGLANLVNEGNNFSGKTITLAQDIDLAGKNWTPIGNYVSKNGPNYPFSGTFEGGNHVIKNLKAVYGLENASANNGVGLFGYTNSPAIIQNVTVENAEIQGSLYVGVIAGYAYTGKEISNCHVKGNIKVDAYWYAGVIGGYGYMNTVENCTVTGTDGSYIKGNDGSYIGGIWGFRGEGGLAIDNCSVTNLAISGVDRVGGISGMAHYGNTIQDSSVSGVSVTATDPDCQTIGLIAGANQGGNEGKASSVVINNTVASNVTAQITDGPGGAVKETVTVSTGTTIGGAAAPSTIVGTGVKMDDSGKIVEGTFEVQPPQSSVASGVTFDKNANGSYVARETDGGDRTDDPRLETDVQALPGAVDIPQTDDMKKALLTSVTQQELAQLEDGAYSMIQVIMRALPSDDVYEIDGMTVIAAYEISVEKNMVAGDPDSQNVVEPVSELRTAIPVSFKIPEAVLNAPEGVKRTFALYNLHGDNLVYIPNTNPEPDDSFYIAWLDHFSPFILTYQDTMNPVAPTAPVEPPKTGDNSQLALWFALMTASAAAMIVVSRKRKAAK